MIDDLRGGGKVKAAAANLEVKKKAQVTTKGGDKSLLQAATSRRALRKSGLKSIALGQRTPTDSPETPCTSYDFNV